MFSYCRAINYADTEFLTESIRDLRTLNVLDDLLGHPPEPTLGCPQPVQQSDVVDIAKLDFMTVSSRCTQRLAISQMNEQKAKQGFGGINFSLAGQGAKLDSFFCPACWQKAQ